MRGKEEPDRADEEDRSDHQERSLEDRGHWFGSSHAAATQAQGRRPAQSATVSSLWRLRPRLHPRALAEASPTVGPTAVALMLAAGALELEWTVPASCPPKEVALARLGPLTGSAAVLVSERRASFELSVSVAGTQRTLTSSTCGEATDAAVLIIQLALQPGAEPVDGGVALPATPVAADAGSALPPPNEPLPTRLQLGASAGLLVGWVPAPLFHAGVDFSVGRGPFFGFARLHTGTRPTLPLGDGRSVQFALRADAAIGACWLFGAGRFRVGPCGGGGVAVAQATLITELGGAWLLLAPWGGLAGRASVAITSWLEAAFWGWARFSAFPVLQSESRALVSGSPLSADVAAGIGGQW